MDGAELIWVYTSIKDTGPRPIVLRSGFGDGLEVALAVEEALRESAGECIRVLAAPWDDSPFPSVAMWGGGDSHVAYRLAIGRSGRAESPLAITAIIHVDQDLASTVDEWFMEVWNSSTPLDRVRGLRQPTFAKADVEVVTELAARWDRFVKDVRVEHEPAVATQEGGLVSTDNADGLGQSVTAEEDPSAAWALFPIEQPGASEEHSESADAAPVGSEGRSSILAVRPSSPLERDLRDIYAKGVLVSVHTSHKVPTFRLDVNAALGIADSARSGRASLRSPIRLDLLPSEVSEEIGRSKRYASNVLQSHSIVLAQNQHWMPLSAVPHFDSVLNVKAESKTVSGLLGVSIEDYVTQNLTSYVQSLTDVFIAQQIRFEFNQVTVDRLGAVIQDYLHEHESVSVTSSYTTEALGYSGVGKGDYTRPFTLLLKAAKTSRKRVLAGDSRRRVIPAPPVTVWDVVGGPTLSALYGTSACASARKQLLEIEQIADAGPSQEACLALITLMRCDPELT